MQLSVPPPRTPRGRVYRYSPNEKALPRHFVLGNVIENFVVSEATRTRMKLLPRSKQTVCPYSGVVADDQDFTHPDDVKAALGRVEGNYDCPVDIRLEFPPEAATACSAGTTMTATSTLSGASLIEA